MESKESRYVIWYDEMEGKDFPFVGKKNANLGEMIKAGIPVSQGFAITIHANDQFLILTSIKEEIEKQIDNLGQVAYETAKKASGVAMQLIEKATMPTVIEDEILSNYQRLCEKVCLDACPVAVRSSGAVSMPGQMETYLNICGEKDLIEYVKKCWASAYNAEAIMYRMNKGMPFLFNIGIGVPKMVNSRVSGIVFTINPINGDLSKISIDASYGLGEAVVSGLVTPDTFLVDKVTLDVVKATIGSKEIQCVYKDEGSDIVQAEVPLEKRKFLCLSTDEVKELGRIGKLIENYYGKAYDIEFGIDADMPFPDNVIILQVRPESVWSKKESAPKIEQKSNHMDRIVSQLLSGVRLR
jgi:pyruvate, water dikinase